MTIRRTFTLILATLLVFSLVACGGKSAYRDDVSVETLSATVEALIPAEGGYDLSGEDFLKYYFDFDGDHAIDQYVIAASAASSDVNEYGILHVSDPKQVETVAELAEVYLSNQRDFLSTFLNTYNAAEMAKLESMEVRVFGNYIVYTILSVEDTAAVMNALESALAAK